MHDEATIEKHQQLCPVRKRKHLLGILNDNAPGSPCIEPIGD